MINEFVYHNLKRLTGFGPNTELRIYEPRKKLYIVKRMPQSAEKIADKLMQLSNPHLCRMEYVCDMGEYTEVVCEYVSGDALADLISAGKLPDSNAAIRIMEDVCDGVGALHKAGIVHRDINPNNIIVTPSGNAVLIDYGIARSYEAGKSADTVILGTPGYAAPEQFGFTQSDSRTDLYALGVLLNVMLTGKMPSEQTANGKLGGIVRKCTAIDPKKRYGSVAELNRALEDAYEEPESGNGFTDRIPGIRSRKLWVVILTALLYGAAIFCMIVFLADGIKRGAKQTLSAAVFNILVFILPFCFFTGFPGRRNKPASAGGKAKKYFFIALGIISIFVGFAFFGVME